MTSLNLILQNLKNQKHKITKIRKIILEILIKSKVPLSAPEMQKICATMHTRANKTTIYRELAFFKSKNIIRQVQLGDKTMRYEINSEQHHHHIVCMNCKKIEDIKLERHLEKEEEIITQTKKFKILHHSLEFYGICHHCQKIPTITL